MPSRYRQLGTIRSQPAEITLTDAVVTHRVLPKHRHNSTYYSDCRVPVGHEFRFMSDFVTPQYKRAVQDGKLILNEVLSYKESCEFKHIQCGLSYDSWGPLGLTMTVKKDTVLKPNLLPLYFDREHPPKGDLVSEAKQTTLVNCHQKIAESPILIAVNMAEFNQTVDLLSLMAKRCVTVSKKKWWQTALKSGWKRRKQWPRRAANEWLQYRYGLRQLYYDVCSIQELMNGKRRFKAVSTITIPVQETATTTVGHMFGEDGYVNDNLAHQSCNRLVSGDIVIKTTMYARPRSKFRQHLHDMGVDNLLSTGWELTKFSWLADWFFDVSDRLSIMDNYLAGRIEGSCTVVTYDIKEVQSSSMTITSEGRGRDFLSNAYSYRFYGKGSANRGNMTRKTELIRRWTNPRVGLVPEPRLRLDKSKVTDLVALVTQFVSNLRR